MTRLLLLSTTTGYQADAVLRAARDLGVEVLLGTDRCHVLDDPWGDGAVPLRFDGPDAHVPDGNVAALAGQSFDAVVALGDLPVVTAAAVCESRGIPFHSPQAARAGRDKLLSRRLLRDAGLLVPVFSEAAPDGSPKFPCVLKPSSMSASRGVIRANNAAEYRAAFERIRALGPGQIMVEDFIPGSEFAIEGIVEQGELHVFAIFDKPDPLDGPYFEETIYVTPSRLPAAAQSAIVAAVGEACRALGMRHGPIHGEVRWNAAGAWILEVAGRPIGGLCSRALRFEGGASLEHVIVRHALGERVRNVAREPGESGVMMIPVEKAGIYTGVAGLDAARAVPGVTAIEITAKPGQRIEPWPEGSSYLGFIFAAGEQPLRLAHAALRFEIAPSLPVLR